LQRLPCRSAPYRSLPTRCGCDALNS